MGRRAERKRETVKTREFRKNWGGKEKQSEERETRRKATISVFPPNHSLQVSEMVIHLQLHLRKFQFSLVVQAIFFKFCSSLNSLKKLFLLLMKSHKKQDSEVKKCRSVCGLNTTNK